MIRYPLLIIILTSSFINLKAQDTPQTIEDLKKSTLPEAKIMLQEQAGQIDGIVKLAGLCISITAGDKTQKTEEDFDIPYNFKPTDSIRFQTQNYLKQLQLSQKLYGSFSTLESDYYSYKFTKIFTVPSNPMRYDLRYGTIYFNDGTKQNNIDTILDEHNIIKKGKLVDSAEIIVDYALPNPPFKITLSAENPSWRADGQFMELKNISPGTFTVAMSDSLNKRIVQVDAINKNDKKLLSTGYSSTSMPSFKNILVLQQLTAICRATIKKITNNNYSNVNELANDLELKTKSLPAMESGQTAVTGYQIKGMAKTINFYIGTGSIPATVKVTLQNPLAAKGTGPLYLAYDTTQQQYGFADAEGIWKIPPFADHIRNEIENFYSVRANNEASASLYQIDMQGEKVKKCPFEIIDTLGTGLYKVEREINGPYGVIRKDGSFVLPMEYGSLVLSKNIFFVRKCETTYGNGPYGAFDLSGNIMLPLAPGSIWFTNNFFYRKIIDTNFRFDERMAVYNIKGSSVLSELYSAEENYFGIDSMLLVTDSKNNHFYVNTQGKKALQTEQYTNLNKFSNGLAAVKGNNGLYGYINTSGQLTIPCMYDKAYPFTINYAFVEMPTNNGGKNYFIKKDGTILKEIKDNITYLTYLFDAIADYILNGVSYDKEGNAVKNEPK